MIDKKETTTQKAKRVNDPEKNRLNQQNFRKNNPEKNAVIRITSQALKEKIIKVKTVEGETVTSFLEKIVNDYIEKNKIILD